MFVQGTAVDAPKYKRFCDLGNSLVKNLIAFLYYIIIVEQPQPWVFNNNTASKIQLKTYRHIYNIIYI